MPKKKQEKEVKGHGKSRTRGRITVGEDGLTDKERKFVDHLVETGGTNHAESARQAGYSERSIHIIANQLLKKPRILDAIARCRRDGYQIEALKSKAFLAAQRDDARLPANIRQSAAKDLLDRGGDKPKDKLEIEEKESTKDKADRLAKLKAKYITQDVDNKGHASDYLSGAEDKGNLTRH